MVERPRQLAPAGEVQGARPRVFSLRNDRVNKVERHPVRLFASLHDAILLLGEDSCTVDRDGVVVNAVSSTLFQLCTLVPNALSSPQCDRSALQLQRTDGR